MLSELAVLRELFWRWWHSVSVFKLLNSPIINAVFLKLMHVCLGSISIVLPGRFSLLPPHAHFLFMIDFCHELLVPPCLPPATFAFVPPLAGVDHSWNWRRQSLKIHYLSQTALLSRTASHGSLASRFLNRPKSALLKSSLVDTAICFIPLLSGSQTPPPSRGHCSQGCPQPLHPQPVLVHVLKNKWSKKKKKGKEMKKRDGKYFRMENVSKLNIYVPGSL